MEVLDKQYKELKEISAQEFIRKKCNIEIWDIVYLYHNENKQGIKNTGAVSQIEPQGLYSPIIHIKCSSYGYASDELNKFEVVRKFSNKNLNDIFSLDKDDVFMSKSGDLLKVNFHDPHKSHRNFFVKYKNYLDWQIYEESSCFWIIKILEKIRNDIHVGYMNKTQSSNIVNFFIESKNFFDKVSLSWSPNNNHVDSSVILKSLKTEELIQKIKIFHEKQLIIEILDFWIQLYEPETNQYLNKDGLFQNDCAILFQDDLNKLNLNKTYRIINPHNFIKINWKLYPKEALIKTIEDSFKHYDYFENNFSSNQLNKPKFEVVYI